MQNSIRRERIEQSKSYRSIKGITKVMDKYFLDPIIGMLPGVGGFLSSLFIIPFIYVSAYKIRSLPLTLAVIFNVLRDLAIGLIPFWIGNVLDLLNRSFMQNMRLVTGFVEGDKKIIEEVNKNAIWMAILIVVLCLIIYWLVVLTIGVFSWFFDLFK